MKIHQSFIVVVTLLNLLKKAQAISVDSNDLMSGEGLFLNSSLSSYHDDSTHSATFITSNGSNILKLVKPDGAQVSYHNGIDYNFQETQIKHVQFKFASSSPDTEDTNLRLMSQNESTLILFRAGRGGLIRVNEKQMISFYNNSVSHDLDIKLTQVDMLINWQDKKIQIFIDNKYADNCEFFAHDVESVSKIKLYNLYSSTSYWSDLVVCSQICYSFNQGYCVQFATLLFMILLINLII